MKCPLSGHKASNFHFEECGGKECAWWDSTHCRCSIRTITNALTIFAQYVNKQTGNNERDA